MSHLRARLSSDYPPDSGQNSLEYWDYSIELEMLQGPQDLQLAAELGKTLLERNRELEANLRQQQHIIDDQSHEIEYLNKQTAALREVNDSRLRIYEQLEISIADVEKSNQRLIIESNADKKRIRSLCDNLECLENRCEDLNRLVDEAEAQERARLRQQRRRSSSDERPTIRRVLSIETGLQDSEGDHLEELLELREEIATLRDQRKEESRRIRDLQTEMSCLLQENEMLQEQVISLRRREDQMHSWQQEVELVERGLCRRCSDDGAGDPSTDPASVNTLLLPEEEHDGLQPQSCALIKLHNGGYAWGSQESLASIGQVIETKRDDVSEEEDKELGSLSSKWEGDGQRDSLLSELDTQYRVLIQKYEALLEAQQNEKERSSPLKSPALNDTTSSVAEDLNDTISGVSPHEDLSDSGSSGFLDEPQHQNKQTQTDMTFQTTTDSTDGTTIPTGGTTDPTDGHFNTVPHYKVLFQEIFSVLKQTVDYDAPLSNDIKEQPTTSCHQTDTNSSREKPPTIPPRFRQKHFWPDSAPPTPACRRKGKRKHTPQLSMTPSPPISPQPYEYKITSPLAEIAKLKKLEKTYAEVLASGLKATKHKLRLKFK